MFLFYCFYSIFSQFIIFYIFVVMASKSDSKRIVKKGRRRISEPICESLTTPLQAARESSNLWRSCPPISATSSGKEVEVSKEMSEGNMSLEFVNHLTGPNCKVDGEAKVENDSYDKALKEINKDDFETLSEHECSNTPTALDSPEEFCNSPEILQNGKTYQNGSPVNIIESRPTNGEIHPDVETSMSLASFVFKVAGLYTPAVPDKKASPNRIPSTTDVLSKDISPNCKNPDIKSASKLLVAPSSEDASATTKLEDEHKKTLPNCEKAQVTGQRQPDFDSPKVCETTSSVQKIKIYPTLSEMSNLEDSESELEPSTPKLTNDLNDLSVDRKRTPGRKTKIIPHNIEVSSPTTDSSFNRSRSDSDSGCYLIADDSKVVKSQSVSEPLSAPPGLKIVAATMEIGLVRDFVINTILLHDHLLQSDGLIGKSYTICYGTVATGISAVEFCVAVTSKVNAAVLPQAVAQTCNKAQNNIWCRWTNLDETISFRMSEQLGSHPFLRKSCFEVLVEIKETKIYRAINYCSQKVFSLFTK